jgi:hypothetical protein
MSKQLDLAGSVRGSGTRTNEERNRANIGDNPAEEHNEIEEIIEDTDYGSW